MTNIAKSCEQIQVHLNGSKVFTILFQTQRKATEKKNTENKRMKLEPTYYTLVYCTFKQTVLDSTIKSS